MNDIKKYSCCKERTVITDEQLAYAMKVLKRNGLIKRESKNENKN